MLIFALRIAFRIIEHRKDALSGAAGMVLFPRGYNGSVWKLMSG